MRKIIPCKVSYFLIFLASLFVMFSSVTTLAATKKCLISNKKISFDDTGDADDDDDYDDDDDEYYNPSSENRFSVNMPIDGILIIHITGSPELMVTGGGLRIELFDSSGVRIQNDYYSLKNLESSFSNWWYNDNLVTTSGRYEYKITSTADDDLNLNINVYAYSDIATSASIKKTTKVKTGNWIKIGKVDGAPLVKSFKPSNKNIIGGWDVEGDGTVWVYGWKKGTSKISLKLKNGKSYTCKVTVSAGDPNFFADVYGYYTRDNFFVVRFKNIGAENLIIHAGGAYSQDADYKSFDRRLRLSGGKNVTVRPGKTIKLRFYINGRTTWYKYSDHTIFYSFTHAGKKYQGRVRAYGSGFKKGGKWYTTYWKMNEDDYNAFVNN